MCGRFSGPSRLSTALCLSLALFLLMSSCAAGGGQVVHENPGTATPSRNQAVDDQMSALLENMMANMDDLSAAVEGGNFTAARASYATFYSSFTKYNGLLWQLNLSESDYRSIADQMNFTNDQARAIVDAAEAYDLSSTQYGRALAGGDTANASAYAARARDSYANISSSYGGLRNNATLLGRVLTGRGLDTGHLESSIGSLDRLMVQYNMTYRNLSIAENGPRLSLTEDQGNLSVGDEVLFRATLKDANGTQIYGGKVVVYVDSDLAGFFVTDMVGQGSIRYIVPINVSGDHPLAHAEYVPSSGPIAVSNYVDLYIRDLPATVTLGLDRDSVSFGDTVNVTGELTAGGQPMPYRPIEISLNGSPIADVHTGEDGSYSYVLPIGPSTPAGLFIVNASYGRKPGDLLLNSSSDDKALSVYARATRLTMNAPGAMGPGFTGSLTTEDGLPVAGANVTVYIDGAAAGMGMTDASGGYRVAAVVPQNASAHGVYAGFSPGAGMALLASSSPPVVVNFGEGGQVQAAGGIPFEWLVFGAFILLIIAISAALLYRRYAGRRPERSMGAAEAPAVTPVEPAIIPEKAAFNVEEEIAIIRSMADVRAATTRAYLASRQLLASMGLKLDDSMTHHEAYRAAAARFPEASRPLKYIVDLYEKAVFASRQPAAREIEEAINSLIEAAARLNSREGGR